MNDKILTMAFMLFFIMIGINAFLYMASVNLYNENGQQLDIYYGLETGGFGTPVQTNTQNTTIGIDPIEISSTAPSTTQGITVVKRGSDPAGLAATNDLAKLGIGVQLVMLKMGSIFPILSPILNAIVFLAFAIQGFAIAYLGSILIRGILGRLT